MKEPEGENHRTLQVGYHCRLIDVGERVQKEISTGILRKVGEKRKQQWFCVTHSFSQAHTGTYDGVPDRKLKVATPETET
jgi:hypothetical protein